MSGIAQPVLTFERVQKEAFRVASRLAAALGATHEVHADGGEVVLVPKPGADAKAARVRLYDGHLPGVDTNTIDHSDPALYLSLRDGEAADWEVEILASCLGHRPLLDGALAPRCELPVGSLAAWREVAALADRLARSGGGPPVCGLLAADVTHELVASALLSGRGDGTAGSRSLDASVFDQGESCRIAFTVAEHHLLICATGQHGALPRGPIARAVSRLAKTARPEQAEGRGALGLLRAIQHGDLVAARMIPGQRTEVLCALALSAARRRTGSPKSIFLV